MPEVVCFVVGARPNFMKTAPVIRALRSHDELGCLLIHTGQHYDPELSDVFLEQLRLPKPDYFLGVGSGTHAEQTARALLGVERVLLERRPALTVVPGDVNSTLAAALAAVKLGIPVAHLEAGLRSFDSSMPEEHNRRLTDHISSVLLAHSESALENLNAEGIEMQRVHLVGNTMIDSLQEHLDTAREGEPWRDHDVEPGGFGLITLHRPALVDHADLLRETVSALCELSAHVPLIFPAHPRTVENLRALGLSERLDRSAVKITKPLGYFDFLGLEAESQFVLTDSGGVQEETSALGVRCFTLRDRTERPVTIERGTNTLLGLEPERIRDIPALLRQPARHGQIPLWDGGAGARSAAVLAAYVDSISDGLVDVRH